MRFLHCCMLTAAPAQGREAVWAAQVWSPSIYSFLRAKELCWWGYGKAWKSSGSCSNSNYSLILMI